MTRSSVMHRTLGCHNSMNSDGGFGDENVKLVELAEQIMLQLSDKTRTAPMPKVQHGHDDDPIEIHARRPAPDPSKREFALVRSEATKSCDQPPFNRLVFFVGERLPFVVSQRQIKVVAASRFSLGSFEQARSRLRGPTRTATFSDVGDELAVRSRGRPTLGLLARSGRTPPVSATPCPSVLLVFGYLAWFKSSRIILSECFECRQLRVGPVVVLRKFGDLLQDGGSLNRRQLPQFRSRP